MERSRWVELEESDCHVDSLVAFGVFKWRRVEINNYFTEILISFFQVKLAGFDFVICIWGMTEIKILNDRSWKAYSLIIGLLFLLYTLFFTILGFSKDLEREKPRIKITKELRRSIWVFGKWWSIFSFITRRSISR